MAATHKRVTKKKSAARGSKRKTAAGHKGKARSTADHKAKTSKPTAPPPQPPKRLSDQLQKEQATAAFRKAMSGQKLTGAETAALKRYEKEQEEKKRWQYYETIPQKHWRQMSGRQTKVLNEQAALYGIPVGGPVISLPDVAVALHDLLAKNSRKFLATEEDEMLAGGATSPALERYREERARLAQLDRQQREQTLLARDEIREGLGRVASILRQAGEALQREYGTDAAELLTEALADAESEIDQLFGGGTDVDTDKPTDAQHVS